MLANTLLNSGLLSLGSAASLRTLGPVLNRSLAQAAHTPEPAHEAVQGLSLSPAQADRVKKAAQLLHAELRLPRDALLRWVPALLRAPHFIQHRVRELRALGLTNADVARLLDSAPALLGPPPVVSQGTLEERMALLGLPTALLQDLLAQRPAAAPLLLKARLSPGEVLELRRHALEFAEGPADAL